MKKFHVEWSQRAQKQMRKLSKETSELILRWVHKNLDDCEDPRRHGKALTADRAGQWRYRIGKYRVIAEIHDDEVIIFVIEVGHRREIYE